MKETLDVGDYILSDKVIVERKRGDDYVGSLCNNSHLFEQLLRLKDIVDSPILIIENLGLAFNRPNMKVSSIYGSMAYIAYKMGIPIIPTRDLKETAILLMRIAYREQVEDNAPVIVRSAPKGMSEEERRMFLLEGLFGTGPKLSRLLIEKFTTPDNVFSVIKQTKLLFTRTGNPKGIEGPLNEVKGIGFKWVQENKKLIRISIS